VKPAGTSRVAERGLTPREEQVLRHLMAGLRQSRDSSHSSEAHVTSQRHTGGVDPRSEGRFRRQAYSDICCIPRL
jgi:hypothetical protein